MNADTPKVDQCPQEQRAPDAAAPASARIAMTDLGNARRLVMRHGADLRFCPQHGRWYSWDGRRWAADETGAIVRFAKEAVSSIRQEAAREQDDDRRNALYKHAAASQSAYAIRSMIELAQSEAELVIATDRFDADPWLLTVQNGTIDLRTGTLGPHRREDLITMLAPVAYDPGAAAPLFERVVANLAGNDEGVVGFLRRAAGYAATALTGEQALFMLYGRGGEGKSAFLEALGATLGEYAQRVPTQTLMATRDGGIPNDVARLRGKRFARASEVDQGLQLAESQLKQLTGGDTVAARFLRQEFFEFKAVCKIFVATNHLPRVKGADRGIWRRIKVVHCQHPVREDSQDRDLPAKLEAERPGILAWIVRGCLEWQRQGLADPTAVTEAVALYRSEMDAVGRFIEECCTASASATASCKEVYSRYVGWCVDNGERGLSRNELSSELRARGFETRKSTGGRYRWVGFALAPGGAPTLDAL